MFAGAAYNGVRGAFEREFVSRIEQLSSLAASQVNPEDVADAARLGEESNGYLTLQVQLLGLRATTGVWNVALVDSIGITRIDVRDPDFMQGLESPYDTLAHAAYTRARRGTPALSGYYVDDGRRLRTGFAPVKRGDHVVGVVAVEAEPAFGPVLLQLQRALGLAALASILAIAVLAALFVRLAGASERLERRLSRAENLAAMGRLTATLAHEIRNPLAIIRGSARRLGKLEPESQRMADSVIEEVDRLSNTVTRYLQFARGDAAPNAAGDAAEALRATLDLLEGEFRAHRVELVRGELPEPAPVPLDNESLKQVFLNLMLNALEALPEGGRVSVALAESHERFEASITDDGPGIRAEVLKPLREGEAFVTTKAQGTGLGLFLSRRLVEQAGGALTIESGSGGGTTCRVSLPRLRT